MAEITVEEARRRKAAKDKAKAARDQPGQPAPLANGHDKLAREIAVADWNSLGEPVAQDNLVAGLLGPEQFGMIYGESGSGKSFITFDMFAHYALGRSWMGRRVKGGGVLYIAAEGRGGWANRVAAFCKHHGIDDEQRTMVPFGFVLESVNLGRYGEADAAAVIRAAETWARKTDTQLDLIAVDTMARATPGSNENDAGDMGAFVANMDLIRRNTGASPVTVHHSGKVQSAGARGHSSLRAAMDMEGEVERVGGRRTMRLRKSRDGSDTDSITFSLKTVEIGTDADGKPITSCVVVPTDAESDAGEVKRQKVPKSQKLLKTVIDQALDRFGIEVALPDGRPTVKAVNAEYARNGYILKRMDLGRDGAKRTFNRALAGALDSEFLLSHPVGDAVYLFWPSKP